MKRKTYQSKAKPVVMRAHTSATIKIRDNFFKVELQEEKAIPAEADVDMKEEWALLFNELNAVCDHQVTEIWDTFKGKK